VGNWIIVMMEVVMLIAMMIIMIDGDDEVTNEL
jgi:hypothetical protein